MLFEHGTNAPQRLKGTTRLCPPTLWMISETNHRRRLKIIFVVKEGSPHIKSAYEPEPEAERIWQIRAPFLPY